MLNMYELYDLHLILVAIRALPDDSINNDVVSSVITVLNNRYLCDEENQIRKALQSIGAPDRNSIYAFASTENRYSYYPLPWLKDERIYAILIAAFEELSIVLSKKERARVIDLADCLHNLPIILVENNYKIPKLFWKFLKEYRNKWNKGFLRQEQQNLKTSVKL